MELNSPFLCRFVISQESEQARFCGSRTAGGPWCAAHREIVYVRVPQRPVIIPRI